MKLLRYGPVGQEKPGTLDAEGRIRDLSGVVADITPDQLHGAALEALSPDDYWGYQALKKNAPKGMLVTTGEHEATRWGFRMLLEMECCDIIQPDVGWCGGVTELIKISAMADAKGVLMIPHGSSVYSYHFVVTRHNSPFAEFLMMAPGADEVVPMFHPQLIGEPVPVNGRLKVPDTPGFGVELNRDIALHRPYAR